MQVVKDAFEVLLIVQHIELLDMMPCLVQVPDVVSDGADCVVQVLVPEVLFEFFHCRLVMDASF